MNNKQFLSQHHPDGPNYGHESVRRVHCPDLHVPSEPTIDTFLNGGSIILLILIALFALEHIA